MAVTEHRRGKRAHQHGHHRGPDHLHGAIDPVLLTTQQGIRAIQWSFLALAATALFQGVIVSLSGSVALLSDTIHNVGDAATAIPLWIAYRLARVRPTRRFTYGYGRAEDLAGVVIILTIVASAVAAGYVSIDRLFHPQAVEHLGAVIVAAIVGFLGNEAVAVFRIRVGRQIGSAALIADGQHARIDGLTSLAVLFGAVGVWLGHPLADPVIGLVITAAIIGIAWSSGKAVFTRLLDGVDPEVVDEIVQAASGTGGVKEVTEVRVRWSGHRLHAEVNVAVDPVLSVENGHEIAREVRHQLLHRLQYLSNASIHVDPANVSGEEHHRIAEHGHGDVATHSH
jgi:cation diffusion facilitator family transporter